MITYALLSLCAIHALAQVCDSETQVMYDGKCLSRECFQDKVPRMSRFSSGYGLDYTTSVITQDQQTAYQVTMTYPDDPTDPLTSDPSCVGWRVYQTVNAQDVDATRKYVIFPANGDSLVPSWPVPEQSMNNTLSLIQFTITQQDLQNRHCLVTQLPTQRQWSCYFEFAFVLGNKTQVSHFYDIVITLKNSLGGLDVAPPPKVDVQRGQTVFVNNCPKDGPNDWCQITLTVKSSLHFCSNANCESISDQPFEQLYVNNKFYMKHMIDDASFQHGWAIEDVGGSYRSETLTLTLDSNSLKIVKNQPGYNIYELSVPIVSKNVEISSRGTLTQLTRMLEEDTSNQTRVVQANQNTGEVLLEPTSVSNSVFSNNVRSGSSSHLLVATSILVVLSIIQ